MKTTCRITHSSLPLAGKIQIPEICHRVRGYQTVNNGHFMLLPVDVGVGERDNQHTDLCADGDGPLSYHDRYAPQIRTAR